MVTDVAVFASDGSFDPPYLDICRAHHEKSISQQRGASSAVIQLSFVVDVRVVYIAMRLLFEPW
jgi:hypothetical protein